MTHVTWNRAGMRLVEGEPGAEHRVTCKWTIDVWDDDTMHETECGKAFVVIDCKSLAEHGFNFCVYCGKPLEELRIDKHGDDNE